MSTPTSRTASGIARPIQQLRRIVLMASATLAAWLALGAVPALAQTPTAWTISASSDPTNFAPDATTTGTGTFSGGLNAFPQYFITATNAGGTTSNGPVTITDTLPAGITPSTSASPDGYNASTYHHGTCGVSGQTVTCTFTDAVQPGQQLQMWVPVEVAQSASGTLSDQVSVSGGGATAASTTVPTPISATPASFGFVPGGVSAQAIGADGSAATQAGSHPYSLSLNFDLATVSGPPDPTYGLTYSGIVGAGHVKDLGVDLPGGLVINPNATPARCTETELEDDLNGGGCPDASQVGVITVTTQLLLGGQAAQSPLYNMVPPKGTPAELGFDAIGIGIYVHLMGGVQTGGDYSLTSTTNDILARPLNPILDIQAELWGDPSDPSHDYVRGNCLNFGGSCPVSASTTPFLSMPSACSGPLQVSANADSWEQPGSFVSGSGQTTDLNGNPVGVDGCGQLDFTPSISVTPDTSVADSPSGLDVDLQVPQNDNVGTLETANLKKAVVTLPAGMSVNPSAANGLAACTPSEIGIDNASEPNCPDASKIGSVQVTTPLLPDVMTGGVYVAQQNNNPFGSLLAIYVTAEADGALIKLAGHVVADPVTGQLETTFDNNPELPFSDFKLDFFGGPQAVLATPEQCGTFTAESSLSPWSGTPAVTSSDPFQISSGCVSGFSPSFTAGTQNAQAGAYSPFVLSFSRSDADQNFSGLSVKLPPGMLAKLTGVEECPDSALAAAASKTGAQEQANPSCPSGSQVGTVETGAGVGPDPFFLPGKAYLTGPYKGAPYGLAVVVSAVAGPYDLGTVVVRQALHIDPTTAQVTDVSDPFPTILQGIPLRIRRIDVDLDRPDFTVNPTSCDVMAVTGTLSSTLGIDTPVSSRFQVGGCSSLGFFPKLQMKLTGRGRTRSGDHPNLVSTLTQPVGQANIHSVKVALPLSLALDPNNSQHVCSYSVAQAVTTGPADCPASTQVGTATAITPLLSQPLSGPVYLVQGIRYQNGVAIHTLPSLLIPLRGQIALDLRAQSSVSGGKLVTTFPTVPDAAVSKFTLIINGGKHGILVITGRGRSICGSPQVTQANLIAQNGKAVYPNIKMGTPCRAVPHHKKKHKKHSVRHNHRG